MRNGHILRNIAAIALVSLGVSGCGAYDDRSDGDDLVEDIAEAEQAGCTCPSGWSCTDLDAPNAPYYTGNAPSRWFNPSTDVGWTKYKWPFKSQKYARALTGLFCPYDKDHRYYFNGSYWVNNANASKIAVRWNGGDPGWPCNSETPWLDYFSSGTINGVTGPYVRLTLGEYCPDTDIALIAP
jgi:hypothetical protein